MKVVTLTVNPAVDKSTTVDRVVAESKLRCDIPKYEPGGGGINVSRAMKKLGYDSLCTYFSGGSVGEMLESLIDAEGVKQKVFQLKKQRTRENFIVVNTTTNEQYRFGMPGPTLTKEELEEVEAYVESLDSATTSFFVISGSVPVSVPNDFYAKLIRKVKSKGIKVICDSSGSIFENALAEGVFLIKPNIKELYALAGRELTYGHEIENIARQLINEGKCELIVVSLGEKGAMLISKDNAYHAIPPATNKLSTVGAGDSMVAGLLIGLLEDLSLDEVIKRGVAAGTSATMNTGTGLCRPEDYNALLKLIQVRD